MSPELLRALTPKKFRALPFSRITSIHRIAAPVDMIQGSEVSSPRSCLPKIAVTRANDTDAVVPSLAILFPSKNNSVKIKELDYATLFNDQNGVQLKAAAKFGIQQPLKNRNEADKVRDGLVRIRDNSHYSIAKLTHSIPYLTDGAAELLDMIGKNFLDSLESKGLNPNKIIVTSVLRTQEDIKKLQKSGNPNAVSYSAHCYATTFDITYTYYDKSWFKKFRFCESVETETLKNSEL